MHLAVKCLQVVGEESGEASVGKSTDSGRRTDADETPGAGGEKYGTDSKNMTSTDTNCNNGILF